MSIGNGSPRSPFGAIPSLTLANAKVFDGIAFSVRKRFDILKTASIDIVFDPTAFTGKNLVILPFSLDAIAGPIQVDIYSGVTANSDGTPIPIVNRDFVNGPDPATVAQLDPTGVVLPAPPVPLEYLVPSDGLGVSTSSATSGEPLVANFDPTEKALMRLTNTDTVSDAVVGLKFDFFEVP